MTENRRRAKWALSIGSSCWLIWYFSVAHVPMPSNANRQEQHPKARLKTVPYQSPYCDCQRNLTGSSEANITPSSANTWDWCGSESSIIRGENQKVIAYALFGQADKNGTRYYSSLRDNVERISRVYSGWLVRLYHNVEKDTVEHKLLCEVYCDNPVMDLCDVDALGRHLSKRKRLKPDLRPIVGEQVFKMNRPAWRFLPMLDPRVDMVMTRDLDGVIIGREVEAVQQWLNSSFTFHVMRDHHYHRDPILAGMFGVRVHQRRDLIQGLTKVAINYGQNTQRYGTDQLLLSKIFWPSVKHDVMAHDSYNCLEHWSSLPTVPFPTQRVGQTFVSYSTDGRWIAPAECPVACRPPEHQDWEYC